MSSEELCVTVARKCLSVGRKSLSAAQCLDLAAQVSAVDLDVKPALLYDSNGASAEQVQLYLSSLQSSRFLSKSLLTLALNGNVLVVNPVSVKSNLERLLHDSGVVVIDVCHLLEKPVIVDPLRGDLKNIAQHLLLLLREFEEQKEAEKPLYVPEKSDEWNLCTVFGLLLGYPVTYWFDQTKSFENCLCMTPLMVTTVSATWRAEAGGHRCCLYSFSIPAVLQRETQSNLENWNLRLQEKFQQQSVLTDLTVCRSMVTLPSVCL
ncbi:UPF0739 protein C1orf74 homolog [Aulostomus maculatus]